MVRAAEIGLISALILAVLAFGGTALPSFSAVQTALLGLAILLAVAYGFRCLGKPSLPITIPLVLVTLVLLQVIPLPAPILRLFRNTDNQLGGTSLATISIAPYETLTHLVILLTYLSAFYLTLVVCQHRSGSKHLAFTLLALGTFEALYGLLQYLTGWQQIFTYVKKYDVDVATGTYINRNHYAGLLEMLLPFTLALTFYQFGKIPRPRPGTAGGTRSSFGHEEFQKLILCFFLSIILFVGLFFSQSRMGIVSAVASTFLLSALIATGLKRAKVAVPAILFLSAGIAIAIWIGPEPVIARFGALGQEYAAAGQNRWAIWRDTLRLIRQHPWLGSGFGTFPIAYPLVQTTFLNWFVNHAHNDYLEFASDLGLPAGLLLFSAAFHLVLQSIRRFRHSEARFDRAIALGCFGSLVAILLHSFTDFNLYIPANALLFAMILGLACATPSREELGGAAEANSPG